MQHIRRKLPTVWASFASRKQDLYAVLGLARGASAAEAKQAYYKLVHLYHPDKNPSPGAKQQFEEISKAYEILADEKRKRLYDSCAIFNEQTNTQKQTGADRSQFEQPFDQAKFREGVFNEFNEFFAKRRGKAARKVRGSDVYSDIHVTFREAMVGKQVEHEYARIVLCETCKGNRNQPGTPLERCYCCGGSGVLKENVSGGTAQTDCVVCEGYGQKAKFPCKGCKGKGKVQMRQRLLLDVDKGIADQQVIRCEGQGNAGSDSSSYGDLLVKVHVGTDAEFRRQGDDIWTQEEITATQAILGCKLTTKTLRGDVEVYVSAGTQDKTTIRIAEFGVERKGQRYRGDHYVVVRVVVPSVYAEEELALYRRLRALEVD